MSIIMQARRELELINCGHDDSNAMLDLLQRFFARWDSGGAVSWAAPVLARLIAGKPLSPLTGADHEWMEVGEQQGRLFQNIRCSTVFKDDAGAYDIARDTRQPVTFPYWPERADVGSPVVEMGV